jgi:hypothetical protein
MNLLETIMHAKLPFVPALILVLAPSAVSLLVWILAHSRFKGTSSKEREDSLARSPAIQHRRDEIRSILLVLGIAALASTAIGAG